MSFDYLTQLLLIKEEGLNPFGTGQCLSTKEITPELLDFCVSIPLEQGNVFRRRYCANIWRTIKVSIPLEQGNVFRRNAICTQLICFLSLNPFGTGQCLSTNTPGCQIREVLSLNPFGTGQCLSTN